MKVIGDMLPICDKLEIERRYQLVDEFFGLHRDMLDAHLRFGVTNDSNDLGQLASSLQSVYAFLYDAIEQSFIAGWFAKERSASDAHH